jgi:uncharacterized repeat protein (TIGR01451 family)
VTASQGSFDPGNGIWDVGTLAIGASATLTLPAEVLDPAVNTIPQQRVNSAAVTNAVEPDPDPSNNRDDATVTPKYADLGVKKTTSNPTPNANASVTYTVSLFNLGTSEATGVKVTDVFPANVEPPALSDINAPVGTTFSRDLAADPTGRTWIWDVGTVPLSATVTTPLVLTVTVKVKTDSTATEFNVVTITSNDVWDPNDRNNSAKTPTTPQQADVVLTKTVDVARPQVGQNVVFTIDVFNLGPSLAKNVEVTDLLPAGLDLVSSNATIGNYNELTGVWDIGDMPMPPSSTNPIRQTLTITATVRATALPFAENTAKATTDTTDPNPDNNTDTAEVTPLQADLAVFKTVSNPTPNVGDKIQYTITAANFGPDNATNVVVTDKIPDGLTFVPGSPNPSAGGVMFDSDPVSPTYRTLTWNIGPLNTGLFPTLVFDVTVDPPSSGNPQPQTNDAKISGTEYDPDQSNNEAKVTETPQ